MAQNQSRNSSSNKVAKELKDANREMKYTNGNGQ